MDTRSYNRGNQGGGSDSESYIARELLAPDEIPKALKRGKMVNALSLLMNFILSLLINLIHYSTRKYQRLAVTEENLKRITPILLLILLKLSLIEKSVMSKDSKRLSKY